MQEENCLSTVDEIFENGTKKEILEKLLYFDYISANGDTVLHLILKNEKLMETDLNEVLTSFLREGVNPNVKNKNEHAVLHLAVERRLKSTVDLLLRFHPNILWIAHRGRNTIAHFFIEDEYQKSKLAALYPIMNTPENREITENCSVSFLEFLISKFFDFDSKNDKIESAVHLAIKYNLLHILPTLLQNSKEKDNEMLLQLFLDQSSSKSVSDLPDENNLGFDSKYNLILNILIDKVITDAGNENSCKIISEAIKKESKMNLIETYIKYFMERCDDGNLAIKLFHELMSTCALWTDKQTDYFLTILSDLIAIGVKLDDKQDQKKLVRFATKAKTLHPLQFLKQTGAVKLNCRFDNGESLLHLLAARVGRKKSSKELRSFVKDLLASGDCQLDDTNKNGNTALNLAVGFQNITMVRILTEFGADVNVVDAEAEAPIHIAVSNANTAIIPLLIENGVNINCKDKNGRTPLHRALAKHQKEEIVKLLLKNGADVNAKDNKGDRPLHLNARYLFINHHGLLNFDKMKSMVKLLLDAGAYVNARNNQGESALFLNIVLSSKGNRTFIINELMKYNADLNDPKVRQLICKNNEKHYQNFLRHWVGLEAANLPLNDEYRGFIKSYKNKKFSVGCLKEIEKMKNTIIDGSKSLYDFLHMHPGQRYVYLNREQLKEVIKLTRIEEQFPIYSVIIQASYNEARVWEKRVKVLNVITEIFSELYNVSVQNVAKKIVNYLDDEDLYTDAYSCIFKE